MTKLNFSLFDKEMAIVSSQTKRYTALLGSLLSGIHIARTNRGITEYVKVPVRYAKGEIFNKGHPDITGDKLKTGYNLPAIAIEFDSFIPDNQRQLSSNIRQASASYHRTKDNVASYYATLAPFPHDFMFNVYIRANKIEEAASISEQIVSVFGQQVSVKMIDNEKLDMKKDISVYLESSYSFNDNSDDQMDDFRFIDVNFQFRVKGYIYKPVKEIPVVLEIDLLYDDKNRAVIILPTDEQKQDFEDAMQIDSITKQISGIGDI